MDDILVIILTLIIAVVGVLNQNKKKKAQKTASEGETNKEKNFWEQLLDEGDVFEQPRPVEEEEPLYTQPVKEQKPMFESKPEGNIPRSTTMAKNVSSEGVSIVKQKKKIYKPRRKFSLREAVIYSEILNRKYT